MQKQHRYQLDKSSKKYYCPRCKKKTFVFFIDMYTGEHLPEQYGRCDRENNCMYQFHPYLDGYAQAISRQERDDRSKILNIYMQVRKREQPKAKNVYFNFETFKKTLTRYDQNIFIQNLLSTVAFPFDAIDVTKVIELYRLGTVANGYRTGAITFPFIDIQNNVRAIQVKQFDKENHTIGTDFLHSIIEKFHKRKSEPLPEWLKSYTKQDKKVSCLFGEHILSMFPENPVALVEAPKSAIYGTLYFGLPQTSKDLLWLAVYNLGSFSRDRLTVLKGRKVLVFPDLSFDGSAFKKWISTANQIQTQNIGYNFRFSDLLEKYASETEKKDGLDIADYLITKDWRLFRK